MDSKGIGAFGIGIIPITQCTQILGPPAKKDYSNLKSIRRTIKSLENTSCRDRRSSASWPLTVIWSVKKSATQRKNITMLTRSLIQQPSSKFNKENNQPLHQVTRGWRSPQLEHTHKVCTAAHMDSTRQVQVFSIMQKPDEVMRMGHSAQRLIAMCHTTREIFHQDAHVSTVKVLRRYQLHPPPPRMSVPMLPSVVQAQHYRKELHEKTCNRRYLEEWLWVTWSGERAMDHTAPSWALSVSTRLPEARSYSCSFPVWGGRYITEDKSAPPPSRQTIAPSRRAPLPCTSQTASFIRFTDSQTLDLHQGLPKALPSCPAQATRAT